MALLTGEKVLVTGAAMGIGLAIVEVFLAEGLVGSTPTAVRGTGKFSPGFAGDHFR